MQSLKTVFEQPLLYNWFFSKNVLYLTFLYIDVPPPVSASLNVSESTHDLTQGDDSLLELFQSLGESNDSVLEPDSDRINSSFSSDSVFNLRERS